MAEFKLTLNTTPQELAGGRPIAPGEVVELSDQDLKDPHNKSLVDQELLLSVESAEESTLADLRSRAEAMGIEGRSKMTKAELEKAIQKGGGK